MAKKLTECSIQCQPSHVSCVLPGSEPPPGILPLELSTWHPKTGLDSGPARGPLLLSLQELVEAAPGGNAGGKEAYSQQLGNWGVRNLKVRPSGTGQAPHKTVSHDYFSFPLH